MWRNVLFLLNVGIMVFASVEAEKIKYLLPKTSVPSHYGLKLTIPLGENKREYSGSVSIDINILKFTPTIVMHAKGVEVSADKITLHNEYRSRKVMNVHRNDENNFLTLNFGYNIKPGNYTLKFDNFRGNISDRPGGLFLSDYTLPNGEKRNYVASYLEPTYARTIFPCYDEPNFKATFKITVTHPKGLKALSNSRVKTVKRRGNNLMTVFEDTKKTSTYLLALAVSDFESSSLDYNGKLLRFHVTPGNAEYTKFALNATWQSLHYLEKIFKVPYTLPKLDSIAVPAFGEKAGMENWGLNVYGRNVILKPNDTDHVEVMELVCHEIVHQWFGNLVTIDGWDYLWLKEGFATYYSPRISDMITSADNTSNTFMNRFYAHHVSYLRTFEDEHFNKSNNLNHHVETPIEILYKFDTISYNKGAVIVRFMSLAFSNFDLAITDYLRKHSFGITKPSDLYESISRRTDRQSLPIGATVDKIMHGWANNNGYPLLTLNITKTSNSRRIEVTQERFLLSGEKSSEKWWIPITLTTEELPVFEVHTPTEWLSDQDESTIIYTSDHDGWIVANIQQMVYCRVNYDIDNWKKIIAYLKGPNAQRIHVLNRIQLLDDCATLAKAGKLPESIALDMFSTVKYEEDELLLNVAQKIFAVYAELLKGTPLFYKYKKFVLEILGPKKSFSVFGNEDLEKRVDNVLNGVAQRSKRHAIVHKITEHAYSEEKLKHIHEVFEQFTRAGDSEKDLYMELFEDVKTNVALNIAAKKMFLTYNYPEVENWLDNNY